MKKRFIVIVLAAIMSVGLIACGTGDNNETVIDDAVTENESEQPEAVETTIKESESETLEESESSVEETESDIEETESDEDLSLSYDDWHFDGYGNFVDGYANGDRIRLTISSNDGWTAPEETVVYDVATYRGISNGDSREKVIELYGDNYSTVTYMNHRYDYNGRLAKYNINYKYLDERFPEVFFCLSFNIDQNDNVNFVLCEAIDIKWY